MVLKLVVGLCALGVLSASDQVGGVLSPGSINGADVRPGSVLRRTASLVPESLGGALLARALAMWREHTPNGDHKRAITGRDHIVAWRQCQFMRLLTACHGTSCGLSGEREGGGPGPPAGWECFPFPFTPWSFRLETARVVGAAAPSGP